MEKEMGMEITEETDVPAVGEKGTDQGKEQAVPEKKYTDDDVDKIIARKIAAERKRMTKLFNEEQQESELEIRERNVLKRELMADAKDTLIGRNLPSSLATLLNYESKETLEHSIEEVSKIFQEAVQQGVTNALRGKVPRTGTTPSGDGLRDAFAPRVR